MIYGSSFSTDDIDLIKQNQNKKLSNSFNNINTSPPIRKYSKFKYSETPQDNNINDNNTQTKRKKSNKRVKFNDNIEIVNVESYKEYNKIYEDEFNNNEYNEYSNYINNYINQCTKTKNNKINRSKCSDCICLII